MIKSHSQSHLQLPSGALLGPSLMRKYFRKQDDAIKFSQLDSDLSVFSQEVSSGGERRFLVCAKETFWTLYQGQEVKHYYEVIPRNTPCKLYFDLEFMISLNPSKNGHLMTERLIGLVNQQLQDQFSCSSFTEDVLILESSNEKKFSIHLIFNKVIFQNNEACGAFVKTFTKHLCIEDKTYLTVKNSDNEDINFIDSSVYSKNRNFRIFLSRKFGKPTCLEVSPIDIMSMTFLENNNYVPSGEFEKSVFFKSLITNVDIGKTCICYQADSACTTKKEERFIKSSTNRENNFDKPSPYTEIDSFISTLIGPRGWIRQWRYYSDSETIVYDIGGSRWCGRLGREHRSNHVTYTCELTRGVVTQGCHDPACRGWRSEEVRLPEWTVAWVRDMEEEWTGDMVEEWGDGEEDEEFLLEASMGY